MFISISKIDSRKIILYHKILKNKKNENSLIFFKFGEKQKWIDIVEISLIFNETEYSSVTLKREGNEG